MTVNEAEQAVYSGRQLSREEILSLADAPLDELCAAADRIREHFCGDSFDMCTIINGKSGRCPEDCKYCAQSAHNCTGVREYPLIDKEKIVAEALKNHSRGVPRYSVVCSGTRLSDKEVDSLCEAVREIKRQCDISVCVSVGMLNNESYSRLRDAGTDRVHNNLETSRRYFPSICTTHSYDDKLTAIRAALDTGMEVCCGGLIGMGETLEDRIDMLIEIRGLGVRSIPVNLLNPIKGTPFGELPVLDYDEMTLTIALFRFTLPDGYIRLAGGRGLMPDTGERLLKSGANASISGDLLTTSGISLDRDMKMLDELGYKVGAYR
ncbi:MAG: biotin synthase BioB [Ruminococcus sp.]|nr:biotin synthase BioB [Ruminococcus sp.]